MTARATWRDDPACRDADPDLFFPIGTTGPALVQIGEAKRICRACPAKAPCLAWALNNGVAEGIWGGATHDERRAIRALPATRPTSARPLRNHPTRTERGNEDQGTRQDCAPTGLDHGDLGRGSAVAGADAAGAVAG